MKRVNANRNLRLQNTINSLRDPDIRWAVPTSEGIAIGLEPVNSDAPTIEFVSQNGIVVLRADKPSGCVSAHGRVWGLLPSLPPTESKAEIIIGAIVKPVGSETAAIMRLRITKGIRNPVGYMAPEDVSEDIKRAFGIKTVVASPVFSVATPRPATNTRPAFILKSLEDIAAEQPVRRRGPIVGPVGRAPAEPIEKVRVSKTHRRRVGPAPARKPLNTDSALTFNVNSLLRKMTTLPRERREHSGPVQLPPVFGVPA
jgi:hypothetical protein